jgi:adenosylcobinamide-GDP ribazoletransferase
MLRAELEAFLGAIRFFTRLPVPAWVGHSAEGLNASARYFPAVGLIVGVVGALVFAVAAALLPTTVAILLSMLSTVMLTGAFHEDGLADTVDGLGGGWSREDALLIMKDSRIGSYGAIALVLALSLKFAALAALPLVWVATALVAGHAVSRFASTTLLATLDYAREDGKAKPLATRIGAGGLAVAALFALAGAALCAGLTGLMPTLLGLFFAAAVTLWFRVKLKRRLGGYTGDCLGATQQLAEIAFYLGLLCRLS